MRPETVRLLLGIVVQCFAIVPQEQGGQISSIAVAADGTLARLAPRAAREDVSDAIVRRDAGHGSEQGPHSPKKAKSTQHPVSAAFGASAVPDPADVSTNIVADSDGMLMVEVGSSGAISAAKTDPSGASGRPKAADTSMIGLALQSGLLASAGGPVAAMLAAESLADHQPRVDTTTPAAAIPSAPSVAVSGVVGSTASFANSTKNSTWTNSTKDLQVTVEVEKASVLSVLCFGLSATLGLSATGLLGCAMQRNRGQEKLTSGSPTSLVMPPAGSFVEGADGSSITSARSDNSTAC